VNAVCFSVTPGEKTHVKIKDDQSASVASDLFFADAAGATGNQVGPSVYFCNETDVTPPDKATVMYVYLSASGTQPEPTGPMGAPVPALPCGPGAGSATTGTITADGASLGTAAASSSSAHRAAPSTPAPATSRTTRQAASVADTQFSRGFRPL
jgi:hypothetical protein